MNTVANHLSVDTMRDKAMQSARAATYANDPQSQMFASLQTAIWFGSAEICERLERIEAAINELDHDDDKDDD